MPVAVGYLTLQSMAYREVNDRYVVPPHVHRTWQWYLVLHGRVEVGLDKRQFELGPLQAVLIPPGAQRSFRAATRSPGYLFVIFHNQGLRLQTLQGRVATLPAALKVHLDDLLAESQRPGPDSEVLTAVLMARILIGLHRGLGREGEAPGIPKARQALERRTELQRQVEAFMASNLHQPLRREDLARAVHLSPPHLARLYRTTSGKTLHQRLTEIRLERSRVLLRESTVPITQIALDVGFNSYSHFTQTFKRLVGLSPSGYRRAGGGTWSRSFPEGGAAEE